MEDNITNTQSQDCNVKNSAKTETINEMNESIDCNHENFANLPVIILETNPAVDDESEACKNLVMLERRNEPFENFDEDNMHRAKINCGFITTEIENNKEDLDDGLVVKIEDRKRNQVDVAFSERGSMKIEKRMDPCVTVVMEKSIRDVIEIVEAESSPRAQSTLLHKHLPKFIVDKECMEDDVLVVVETSENSKIPTKIVNGMEKKTECTKGTETLAGSMCSDNEQNLKPNDVIDCIATEDETNLLKVASPKERNVHEAITSLALLASAYDNSDSENDEPLCVYEEMNNLRDVREMEVQITKEYRNKPTITSSDEESDSDSSEEIQSSSSEVESDESEERNTNCRKKNERNRYRAAQEKEMKGEYDNLPPIEELKISVPEVLCDPLGEVGWMVEQLVVVKPKSGKPTLNLDTVLFIERGKRVLGRIFDVFGQVSEPHYCVRFNSTEHIKESDIKVGMIVYFCPNTEYTSVLFLQDLLKMKAADEIDDDEIPDFSDDEEERSYYAALKHKEKTNVPEVAQKRQRTDGQQPTWKSNHPWSTGRKQQQGKKSGKMYKTPERTVTQQNNVRHSPNFWQYPSSFPNNTWPGPESFQGWPTTSPQNSYGYSQQFGNRQPQINNPRQFFRPPHVFQSASDPYAQNRPYQSQSNSPRYPIMNFSWESQAPRQPDLSWSVPPPPPPPPGI